MLKRVIIPSLSPMFKVMILALFSVSAVYGQSTTSGLDGTTPSAMAPGAPAGSYPLSGFENINLFSRRFNFSLPLLPVGGRGSASYTTGLRMESKWHVQHEVRPNIVCDSGGCTEFPPTHYYFPTTTWWGKLEPGYGPGVLQGRHGGREPRTPPGCPSGVVKYVKTVSRITFTAADGTEYEFRDRLYNGEPKPTSAGCSTTPSVSRGTVFVTRDGSTATLILDPQSEVKDEESPNAATLYFYPSGYMTLKDGTKYRIDNGTVTWIRDRNGNQLSFGYDQYNKVSTVTDSLNRQITYSYSYQNGTQSDLITFNGFQGATRTIEIGYTSLGNALRPGQTLKDRPQLFPTLTPSSAGTNYDPPVVAYVKLPDGRQYTFFYDSYGQLARIVLPTGGAIEYDYSVSIAAGSSGGGDISEKEIIMQISERRLYPTGAGGLEFESKTVYESNISAYDGCTVKTYTSDANHNLTLISFEKHNFNGNPRGSLFLFPTDYSPGLDGKESLTDVFDADGTTLLRRIDNTWDFRQAVSWPGATSGQPGDDPRLISTITTLAETNQVSKRTFGYSNDLHNNQTDVYEYDYGAGAPPAYATRRTHTDYVTANIGISYADPANGQSYTASDYHLRNLPAKQIVYSVNPANGAETKAAQTEYEYDNYNPGVAYHANLLGRSDISGMDSAYTATNSNPARGNVTAVTQYKDAVGLTGAITTFQQYDVAGNALVAIDAGRSDGSRATTTFEYNDRFGAPNGEARANDPLPAPGPTWLNGQATYAFPTKATNQLGHAGYTQFDYFLGKPVDSEDANGLVTKVDYKDLLGVPDPLDRPTQVVRGANLTGTARERNRTLYTYNDSARLISTSRDLNNYGDGKLKSESLYDGLGRTIETRQYETTPSYITSKMTYDALGRVEFSYNPRRTTTEETYGWAKTTYDALSRAIRVESFDKDGNLTGAVQTAYSGNRVLVTDQAGKQRLSQINALGQLAEVWEIKPADTATESVSFPGHPEVTAGYRSAYAYDALSSLRTVTQRIGASGTTQTRSFEYDSLKRLTKATNPESGDVFYRYDNNSNLIEKAQASSGITYHTYDALNRVTHRYGAVTEADYYYDNQALPFQPAGFARGSSIGRLVAMTSQSYLGGGYKCAAIRFLLRLRRGGPGQAVLPAD